jgi:alpha-glucosidase (family GH31 glycosyl hydrolase)
MHGDEWFIYLPQGLWRDFWTGDQFYGGKEFTQTVKLDEIPVFARAGAIIPLLDPSPDTLLPVMDEPEIKVAGNDLRLQIYPGADGNFTLHDGTQFSWHEEDHILEIRSQRLIRWVSVRLMGEPLQAVNVQDQMGNSQQISETNLNGEPDHFRFLTEKDNSYSVSFSKKEGKTHV